MSPAGDADLLVRARTALLDALAALADHRKAVVVIGAQAIYLHTGGTALALAEATKDSDLALDPRLLAADPLIEDAMRAGGFQPDPTSGQPGAWVNADGIPVDLMVPEALAGGPGRRSARVPPHGPRTMRRAQGLEATVVDHSEMRVTALEPSDAREHLVRVASPAALLVAKLHKIGEREEDPRRLEPKDAHDVYRLLVTLPTEGLALGARSAGGCQIRRGMITTVSCSLISMMRSSPSASRTARSARGTPEPRSLTRPACQHLVYRCGFRMTWIPLSIAEASMVFGGGPGLLTSTRSSKTRTRTGPWRM